MVFGRAPVVEHVTAGIAPRTHPVRAIRRRIGRLFGRASGEPAPAAPQGPPAEPTPENPAP